MLPPVSGGRLEDRSLRAWLARSDLTVDPRPRDLLARITDALALPCVTEGLAALRMWGQTGDRPAVWIAGADPVYLEPVLDTLRLHALRRDGVAPADLRALFDHLQQTLADDRQFGFARLGACGYLRAERPIATSLVPANAIDGRRPDDFLPEGDDVAAHRNLLSEIEMALHDHDVNQRRESAGQQPINSLWLWGGGMAPQREMRKQPPLFANEPLLLGYWESAMADAELWPGSIAGCAEATPGGFVAVTPQGRHDTASIEGWLRELQGAVQDGRIGHLIVLFRDGLRADIRRSQRLRFWRRDSELLA